MIVHPMAIHHPMAMVIPHPAMDHLPMDHHMAIHHQDIHHIIILYLEAKELLHRMDHLAVIHHQDIPHRVAMAAFPHRAMAHHHHWDLLVCHHRLALQWRMVDSRAGSRPSTPSMVSVLSIALLQMTSLVEMFSSTRDRWEMFPSAVKLPSK